MKILKKPLAFLAVLLAGCAAALLPAGCSFSSAPAGSELPADGIVRRSVFQDAGDSLSGAAFSSDLIRIRFHEKRLIQAKTTLRVDFPALLNASKVRLYRKDSGETERLLEAPLNQGKHSSVTFPVSDTNGEFYLASMDPSFRENSSKIAPGRRDGSQASFAGAGSGREPASGGDADSASGGGAEKSGDAGFGRGEWKRPEPGGPGVPGKAETGRAGPGGSGRPQNRLLHPVHRLQDGPEPYGPPQPEQKIVRTGRRDCPPIAEGAV